jgi:hypothetical protein
VPSRPRRKMQRPKNLPAVGLACAGDPLGEEEFEVWAVGIDPDARVYEVHEPRRLGVAGRYPPEGRHRLAMA